MDTFNLVLIGILTLFAVIGAFRGLSGELATILAALLSAALLWMGAPYLRDTVFYFAPDLPRDGSIFYTAIVSVVLAFFLFFFIAKILKKIVKWAFPQPFDAILGALFGAAKAFLIISIVAGILTASKDYITSARQKAEESVIANAAATFWANRFALTQASKTALSHANISEVK